MGLSDAIARAAARHAHVLVVEVPGQWRTRAALERHVAARGWTLAMSPADADVLAVCGVPGERLSEAVELVWHQMPGPRVRVDVHAEDDLVARLDEARAALLGTEGHREDSRTRATPSDLLESAGDDHGETDHGDMGHGDMDHGDMDMAPDGIPLAQGGEDRDGLEMDVLHVPLGPVLPYWPAGLVLRCSLQGDVIVEAAAEVLGASAHQRAEAAAGPARRCDNVAALLALAGWDDTAAEARALRDDLLTRHDREGDGPSPDGVAAAGPDLAGRAAELHRRIRRSRPLRWSLRGIRLLDEEALEHHGLPAQLVGDTHDRLLRMLERIHSELSGDRGEDPRRVQPHRHPQPGMSLPVHHVARLVTGLDLATARLVVASLDLHELHAEPADHEVAHA